MEFDSGFLEMWMPNLYVEFDEKLNKKKAPVKMKLHILACFQKMWVIKPLKFPFQEFPFQDMYMIMATGNFFVMVEGNSRNQVSWTENWIQCFTGLAFCMKWLI